MIELSFHFTTALLAKMNLICLFMLGVSLISASVCVWVGESGSRCVCVSVHCMCVWVGSVYTVCIVEWGVVYFMGVGVFTVCMCLHCVYTYTK